MAPRPSAPADPDLPDVPGHVEVVRRFNRSYTQRIGVLDDSFLGLGMPLGTARLLYEIGVQAGTTRDLRARLQLDSGYLSRLLRRLESDALVSVEPDPDDRRRRRVDLTPAGRRAWDELERRSGERARHLVAPLTERQRDRLAAALAEADLLVRAATVEIEQVDPTDPAALAAVRAYVDELDERFPGGFAVGDLTAGTEGLRPPDGAFVVATSDGVPVACGGVQPLGGGVGEIKRMWVHPQWRGAGLGSRLLRHLEGVAADLGHTTVRLDTNGTLTEAVAMYERAGYRAVDRYNDNPHATHFFAKRLRRTG
ncbi:MarR family transcriptional regulator with acetyltransferase activity [Isoptericola sp. CG 20/1183]|uniref:MarR family transcriptional regulator with acetyltransferase activity n=1 Tax=Isoptericola halotolerans TaxID=300560 RepID=A0ABX5ED60_9MICO|nr:MULTISPECIES: helix-turn-helix domain-containing GNAT family N-acetyltransferase [Isoptericola]PRZ05736.1 MarR family transcriptional regulator with acetyltransferase activity [Isoptericola halotolerans]PRZ06304.1 MarR family transcriptional regulator with acetyltransferase activity [Isoptericola sp. CG 20/1183]